MLKKLYFCETNGYNMVISVDAENNCKFLTEKESFPYILNMDEEEKEKAAKEFLEDLQDESGFEDDLTYEQLFVPGTDIISEIERNI